MRVSGERKSLIERYFLGVFRFAKMVLGGLRIEVLRPFFRVAQAIDWMGYFKGISFWATMPNLTEAERTVVAAIV